jgi:tetratricopeptide (TPR) repeat protein
VSIKAQGEHNSSSLAKLDEFADCYARAGEPKEAEALFKKEVTIAEKAYGKQSTLSANAHLALGAFLLKQGRCAEAATNLGQALTVLEKMNGPQHQSLAPILDSYSEALDKSNRKIEARKLAARAKDIRG